MQWLFESFIFCSSFSGLVLIVPDFGRKYPDGEEFLRKCWGCLGVRGGFWVEGGWRGSKGGGCESSANKLADRLWISIYTAFAGCDDVIKRSWSFFVFQSTQPSQAVTAIIPNKNHILTDIIIYNAYIFN